MGHGGRKRKDLGPDWDEDDTADQVRCRLCAEANPEAAGHWIARRGAVKHMTTRTHLQSVALRQSRLGMSEAAAREEQSTSVLEDPYAAEAIELRGLERSFENPSPGLRFTGAVDATQDVHGISAADFVFTEAEQAAYFPEVPSEIDMATAAEELLRAEFERLVVQAQEEDVLGPLADGIGSEELEEPAETASEDLPHSNARAPGVDERDEQDLEAYLSGIPRDRQFPPYGTKTMLLLHCFMNTPHFRLPVPVRRLLLWVMRECGARDVPSLRAYNCLEEKLRKECGVKTEQQKSEQGNIFYTNSITDLVCRDLSQPDIAQHLVIYPDETPRPFSEFHQASYHKDLPPTELTPSYYGNGKHFFVNEVCRLRDGSLVIPRVWVTRHGTVYAHCTTLSSPGQACFLEQGAEDTLVRSSMFVDNFPDLVKEGHPMMIADGNGNVTAAAQNPDRDLAGGDDLITIYVPLFCDDVSGARSKQYQKHINVYYQNWSLPNRLHQGTNAVHFLSTSQIAGSSEQLAPILEAVKNTRAQPVRCYNASTHRFCRFRLLVPFLPADNPQQSEESSHAGKNCKCRRCKKGGPPEQRESNEGYHRLYYANHDQLRTVDETRQIIQEQIRLASLGVEKPIGALQTASGIKDKIATYWIERLLKYARQQKKEHPELESDDLSARGLAWLATQTSTPMNPLLNVPHLDPHRDTPVELLHTWLLGVVKYVWHHLHSSWSGDAPGDLFAVRLQDIDTKGLNIPPIRAAYFVQYKNNLIGKHFKTLAQTLAFKIHGIATPKQLTLVRTMGELSAMLWVTEITDMKEYLADLEVLIGNLLDAFADIDPARIIEKTKLQVLPHVIDDIPRFGPAPRTSTELYESSNSIFRLCSIFSNHQAPSRDIAVKMANQDCVKHIVTGGYWQDTDGRWVRAGENVISAFRDSPLLQQVLGIAPRSPEPSPGAVILPPKAKRSVVRPEDTCASQARAALCSALFSDCSGWIVATSVVAQSHDICPAGSWAVIQDLDGRNVMGNILEVLAFPENHTAGLVTFEKFAVGAARHPHLGMPMLRPETDENSPGRRVYHVVPSASVLFIVNVQHDCQVAGCTIAPSGEHTLQEREQTDIPIVSVSHKTSDRRFVVNTHALHNAALLRQFLPRTLTAPQPLYSDRRARHHELATGLRVTEAKKRAETQRKRQATQAKKAAAAATAVPTVPGESHRDDHDDDPELVEEEHMQIDGEESMEMRGGDPEPPLMQADSSRQPQAAGRARGSKRRRMPE